MKVFTRPRQARDVDKLGAGGGDLLLERVVVASVFRVDIILQGDFRLSCVGSKLGAAL